MKNETVSFNNACCSPGCTTSNGLMIQRLIVRSSWEIVVCDVVLCLWFSGSRRFCRNNAFLFKERRVQEEQPFFSHTSPFNKKTIFSSESGMPLISQASHTTRTEVEVHYRNGNEDFCPIFPWRK